MKRPLLIIITFCLLSFFGSAAQEYTNAPPSNDATPYMVRWMELLYDRVEGESRNVPQAARIYAYAGVAVYESMRGAFPERPSLSGYLTDMPAMPAAEPGVEYDWITVMNGTLTALIPELLAPVQNFGRLDTTTNFNTAESNATSQAIRSLAALQLRDRAISVDRDVLDRSLAYGREIAAVIAAWAAADGFIDMRAMTAAYVPPVGEGLWIETTPGQHAMEPYWGTLRPFVMPSAEVCHVPLDVPFDTDLDSTFHAQAIEVRDIMEQLTDEQAEIAEFWDERVGESGTASGHWLYVQNLLADYLDLDAETAAQMYAFVGVSMADAFISAWYTKYDYNLLRPETYIQTYIDPTFRPLRQAPPFPAYPSGHAVLGGSVSAVLTALLGPVAYQDRYGVQYGLRAREYTSFYAAAYENAISRLYGGVHYRVDMENGLKQGQCVGQQVVDHLLTPEMLGE
ncbi:MAG: hypothetical protein OHK0046_41590 [Anaerolineae bacterium]